MSRTAPEPGSEAFAGELEQLRARLDRPSAAPDALSLTDLQADLETAYEELRVADEEARTQQTHLETLRERHDLLQWQHERMLTVLPVPALVTDRTGRIRYVNAATASLLSRAVAHLVGKPIHSLFDVDDRRALRDALRSDASVTPVRRVATLRATTTGPLQVEVSLSPPSDATPQVTWLLTPIRDEADHDRRLASALVELAGLPSLVDDQQKVLTLAAALCARTLRGHDVTISLGPPGAPDAVASTSDHAQTLDGAQVLAGEGPCITAHTTREVVVSHDLRSDPRWPRLAQALTEDRPVAAVAAPIEVGPRLVGAVNAYDVSPVGDVPEVAALLAATLGAVLYELELVTELDELSGHLQRALASRAEIDQAKGIIMAARGGTPDEAFAHLASLASEQERKVRDVARLIVEQASRR